MLTSRTSFLPLRRIPARAHAGRRRPASCVAALLVALAVPLSGCSSETRQLLNEEGPHKAPNAEVAWPNIFEQKPNEKSKALTAADQQKLKSELLQAGANHKAQVEAELASAGKPPPPANKPAAKPSLPKPGAPKSRSPEPGAPKS